MVKSKPNFNKTPKKNLPYASKTVHFFLVKSAAAKRSSEAYQGGLPSFFKRTG